MTTDRNTIAVDAEKLRELTEASLMSWTELARAAGLSMTGLRGARAGQPCRPGTVRKLAAALHVEPLELIKK